METSRRRRSWVHDRTNSLLGVSRSGREAFRHCSAAGPGKWRVAVLDRIGIFSGIQLPLRTDEFEGNEQRCGAANTRTRLCCKKRRALEKMGQARLFLSERECCDE